MDLEMQLSQQLCIQRLFVRRVCSQLFNSSFRDSYWVEITVDLSNQSLDIMIHLSYHMTQ